MSSESPANDTLTGVLLTDLEILAYADDITFASLCSTNKRLNEICTNPRYQNQLYERKIQLKYPRYLDLVRGVDMSRKEVYRALVQLDYNRSLSLLIADYTYFISGISDKYLPMYKLLVRVNPKIFTKEIFLIHSYNYGKSIKITRELWPFMPQKLKEFILAKAVSYNYLDEVKWMLSQDKDEDTFNRQSNVMSEGNYRMFKLLEQYDLNMSTIGYQHRDYNDLIGEGIISAAENGKTEELEEFKKDGLIPKNLKIWSIETHLTSETLMNLFEWFRENGVKVRRVAIIEILGEGKQLSPEIIKLLKTWPKDLTFS